MKSKLFFAARALLLGFIILHSSFCLRALGQNYTVDWYKIAGGGGTIGQADASGPMSGGNYSVTGGFWAYVQVVQTPSAPTLYLSQSGNVVTVYWQNVSGWSAIQNNNLTTPLGS